MNLAFDRAAPPSSAALRVVLKSEWKDRRVNYHTPANGFNGQVMLSLYQALGGGWE